MKNKDESTRRDSGTQSDRQPAAPTDTKGCAHTPGPWFFQGICIFAGKGETLIARADYAQTPLHVAVANASLMAAAPDMLAEFKDQLRWIDRGSERYARVVALIAKAEDR